MKIIDIDILPQGEYTTPTKRFKALIREDFTRQWKIILNKKLYEVFQKKNESIKEYHKNICDKAEKLAFINAEKFIKKKKNKDVLLRIQTRPVFF